MRLPKPRALPPSLPVAPLANISLLLVFFFLLSMRIDASVRYAVVDDVLETLRKAGVRNIVLGARPDTAGGV